MVPLKPNPGLRLTPIETVGNRSLTPLNSRLPSFGGPMSAKNDDNKDDDSALYYSVISKTVEKARDQVYVKD